MDKDRDISRSVTTITPKKVGFVGGAFLAGSALLAACGGGSKSARTPEGGVAGAQSNPTTGQTIEVKTAVMPSATAVVEAPTVVPTATPMATAETALTQEQISQIVDNVKGLISTGLSENQVTKGSITLAGGDIRYLDPNYIAKAFDSCDFSKFGQPFYSVNLGQTVEPSVKNYSTVFFINCLLPADASKALFKATGDPKFSRANVAWKPVARQIFEQVRTKDPRIDESAWQAVELLDFIPQ